jgi:hypothetical protein
MAVRQVPENASASTGMLPIAARPVVRDAGEPHVWSGGNSDEGPQAAAHVVEATRTPPVRAEEAPLQ